MLVGTLIVPDSNHFGGFVQLKKKGEMEFIDIPLTHQFDSNSLGVADMVGAILNGQD